MAAAASRAALVLLAVAGLALAVVWRRDHERIDRGTKIGAAPNATPAQRQRAIEILRSAGRLSADNTPLLVIASLEAQLGRRDEAVRDLLAMVRREPENAVAWSTLAAVEAHANPRLAAAARRRAAELNPLGSG